MNHIESTSLKMPAIIHASFLRTGGVSALPYETLNVGENVADDPQSVQENIRRCLHILSLSQLAKMNQVHGKKVCAVSKAGDYECDALISNEPQLALMVRHADCQPGLLYDPVTESIGAVHAGWKGLTQNIYQETIVAMKAAFDVDPKNLRAWIGPSLGPEHSEFLNYEEEFPEHLHKFLLPQRHMDLRAIGKQQLIEAGILEENIEVSPLCTYEEPGKCFSYRRDGVTGRHGTIIALKGE